MPFYTTDNGGEAWGKSVSLGSTTFNEGYTRLSGCFGGASYVTNYQTGITADYRGVANVASRYDFDPNNNFDGRVSSSYKYQQVQVYVDDIATGETYSTSEITKSYGSFYRWTRTRKTAVNTGGGYWIESVRNKQGIETTSRSKRKSFITTGNTTTTTVIAGAVRKNSTTEYGDETSATDVVVGAEFLYTTTNANRARGAAISALFNTNSSLGSWQEVYKTLNNRSLTATIYFTDPAGTPRTALGLPKALGLGQPHFVAEIFGSGGSAFPELNAVPKILQLNETKYGRFFELYDLYTQDGKTSSYAAPKHEYVYTVPDKTVIEIRDNDDYTLSVNNIDVNVVEPALLNTFYTLNHNVGRYEDDDGQVYAVYTYGREAYTDFGFPLDFGYAYYETELTIYSTVIYDVLRSYYTVLNYEYLTQKSRRRVSGFLNVPEGVYETVNRVTSVKEYEEAYPVFETASTRLRVHTWFLGLSRSVNESYIGSDQTIFATRTCTEAFTGTRTGHEVGRFTVTYANPVAPHVFPNYPPVVVDEAKYSVYLSGYAGFGAVYDSADLEVYGDYSIRRVSGTAYRGLSLSSSVLDSVFHTLYSPNNTNHVVRGLIQNVPKVFELVNPKALISIPALSGPLQKSMSVLVTWYDTDTTNYFLYNTTTDATTTGSYVYNTTRQRGNSVIQVQTTLTRPTWSTANTVYTHRNNTEQTSISVQGVRSTTSTQQEMVVYSYSSFESVRNASFVNGRAVIGTSQSPIVIYSTRMTTRQVTAFVTTTTAITGTVEKHCAQTYHVELVNQRLRPIVSTFPVMRVAFTQLFGGLPAALGNITLNVFGGYGTFTIQNIAKGAEQTVTIRSNTFNQLKTVLGADKNYVVDAELLYKAEANPFMTVRGHNVFDDSVIQYAPMFCEQSYDYLRPFVTPVLSDVADSVIDNSPPNGYVTGAIGTVSFSNSITPS